MVTPRVAGASAPGFGSPALPRVLSSGLPSGTAGSVRFAAVIPVALSSPACSPARFSIRSPIGSLVGPALRAPVPPAPAPGGRPKSGIRMRCWRSRSASVRATGTGLPSGSMPAKNMAVATVPGVGMKHCTCRGDQPRAASQRDRVRMSSSVQPGKALSR